MIVAHIRFTVAGVIMVVEPPDDPLPIAQVYAGANQRDPKPRRYELARAVRPVPIAERLSP